MAFYLLGAVAAILFVLCVVGTVRGGLKSIATSPPRPNDMTILVGLTNSLDRPSGGGTVSTALSQVMRVGINDSGYACWNGVLNGRDFMENLLGWGENTYIQNVNGNSNRCNLLMPGQTRDNYGHWAETYNPAQAYPGTINTDSYGYCVYNGIQYQRTTYASQQTGIAPNSNDPAGSTSGWKIAGYADASLVNADADGRPTQLPTDTNLTVSFYIPYQFPNARYPVTIHCKNEPGVKLNLLQSSGTITMSNQNVAAGTFDLTITGDHNGTLVIDRTTPISSNFFLSGIPTYETGTAAKDIGAPYIGLDMKSDLTPFLGFRAMGSSLANRFAGGPNGTLTSATNTVGGIKRLWKYNIDLAVQCGHKIIWVNMPDTADNTYIDAMATYYLNNLPSNITCIIEWSNECWNFSFQQNADLNTYATGQAITLAQAYSRKARNLASRWKNIWNAAGRGSQVKAVAAWQSVAATSTFQSILDFENGYQYFDILAVAPYYLGNNDNNIGTYANASTTLRTAVSGNNQTNFNAEADSLLRTAVDQKVTLMRSILDWLTSYNTGKGLSAHAILLASYEASQSVIVDENSWVTGLGAGMGTRARDMFVSFKRSATFGGTESYFIDQMAAKAPHLLMAFQYASPSTGNDQFWSYLDRTGNTTQQAYTSVKAKALSYNSGQGLVLTNATGTLKVGAGSPVGTACGTVSADYGVTFSTTSTAFAINASTGAVTVADASAVASGGTVSLPITQTSPEASNSPYSNTLTVNVLANVTGATTWNPSDKDAGITLANSNTTASGTNADTLVHGVRCISGIASGKYYFEIEHNGSPVHERAGLGLPAASLTSHVGSDANAFGWDSVDGKLYINGIAVATLTTYAWNTLGFAIDFTAQLAWFRVEGGAWINSGDPVAGTGGVSFSSLGLSALKPMWSDQGNGTSHGSVNLKKAGALNYTPPTGYTAWPATV